MRGIAGAVLTAVVLLATAVPASGVTITNDVVTLGLNPAGDLNDQSAQIGLTYNATGHDSTIQGLPSEGWGAGAGGPARFEGRANQDHGGVANATPVSFVFTAATARSVVDILSDETPALRLTQDFHPSPTTPNLYEITTTLENVSGAALSDVRYERLMDWDIEPTATDEFVTINRGRTPPAALTYSDDNGFGDNFPFSARAPGSENGPLDASSVNTDYVDKGPEDHGARFTFSFGDLAAGEVKEFFLYYGAAGTEQDANAAVSAAALEMYSYGQTSVADGEDADMLPDGPAQGKPNTFIWGFRAVGGTPVIPPTLTLTPDTAAPAVGTAQTSTVTLRDSDGHAVPGAEIVFSVSGAHTAHGGGATDANGQRDFTYSAATPGDDTVTACLDSNSNGTCDGGEVTARASRSWRGAQPPPPPPPGLGPQPELGESVVAGTVSGTVRVRLPDGRFRILGAAEEIPLGSEVDATKGRVRLTSAASAGGATQTADFYQGQFVVTQTAGSRPVTQLRLSARLRCTTRRASSSQRRRKVRRLWGDGRGRFRTRGRHGAATVRGTRWLTEDRCTSTKFTVRRGSITVRDFVKRENRVVRRGKSYVIRKRRS